MCEIAALLNHNITTKNIRSLKNKSKSENADFVGLEGLEG